ncbi:MAG: hypothetical protein AAB496_01080 [Patescibacteria group bacterium]
MKITHQKLTALIIGGVLVLSLMPIPPVFVLAGPLEVRNFTASISPTTEDVGETQSYIVTITNSASSTKKIKGAKITIPSGFTGVSGISVGGTACWMDNCHYNK